MYSDFKSETFNSSGYSAQGTIILQYLSDCFCQLINCNNTSINPFVHVRPELKQSIEVTLGSDNGDNACVLVICCRHATRYARPTSHVAAHLSFHHINNVITVLTFVIGPHLHRFIQFLHLRLSCYWRTITLKMLDTEWLALTLGNWYLALKSPAEAWTEYCAVRGEKSVQLIIFSDEYYVGFVLLLFEFNQVWSRARHVQRSARKYWTIFLFLHNLPSDVQTSFCKVHLCSVVIFYIFIVVYVRKREMCECLLFVQEAWLEE